MAEFEGLTILLVDDDPDSLNLMRELFALQGAQVYQTNSSEELIKMLDKITPSLIVTDLAMPMPDGWQVLRTVRSMPRLDAVPVIAVTAFYSDTVETEAMAAGFSGFIPKPFKAAMLIEKVKQLV